MTTQPWLSVSTRPCGCAKKSVRKPVEDGTQANQSELVAVGPAIDDSGSDEEGNNGPVPNRRRLPQPCCLKEDVYVSRSPSEFMRKNGFERPFNLLQVISWVVFFLNVLLFYPVIVVSLPVAALVCCAVLYSISAAGVLGCAIVCTKMDPRDPNIFLTMFPSQEHPRSDSAVSELEAPERLPTTLECELCGKIESRTKHCRACNKCVSEYDHHCKWLNNCIGRENYRQFLLLLFFVGAMTIISVCMALYTIIGQAVGGLVEIYWKEYYGGYSDVALYSLSSLIIIINLPLMILNFQLVFLHIYLVRNDMTTYDYITGRVAAPTDKLQRKKFWGDWIVINKKKLKKARRRRQQQDQHRSIAESPVEGGGGGGGGDGEGSVELHQITGPDP
eukprot:GHVU01114263.1.p1 GENE.GHVU01114263.1~~GHVU01114263.1.p1  ORF type:complete len:389 (+),score=72.07 GHVU01114263.1:403-1569(+)